MSASQGGRVEVPRLPRPVMVGGAAAVWGGGERVVGGWVEVGKLSDTTGNCSLTTVRLCHYVIKINSDEISVRYVHVQCMH